MKIKSWVVLGASFCGLATSSVADACGGGGVVTTERQQGSLGANTQRVLLSVHDDGVGGGPDGTDVVTQIGVPESADDYGALLPLPSEPTLDPTPVSEEELAALDQATAPQIVIQHTSESDSDSGCGCPFVAGSKSAEGGGDDRSTTGAKVSEPVNIGPVTAVTLTGTSDAVNAWLADNGFAISADDQAIIDEYTGYYFVAIRRNESAALGGPTSIGIHFTMPGDHRELPFRFARIGAGPTVAFTVFVATSEAVGPSAPFAALTLNDLDANTLRTGSYDQAVRDAVQAHDDRAFVLESTTLKEDLPSNLGSIGRLIHPGTLTRMSTILPLESLTEDAHFETPYDGEVPRERWVKATQPVTSRQASMGVLALLLFVGGWRRRAR